MKEYNRQTENIHAPKELVEKTKAAVREEEKKLFEHVDRITAFVRGSAAAVAILAVIVISVPVIIHKTGGIAGNRTESNSEALGENQGKLLLSQDRQEPEILNRNRTVIKKGSLCVTQKMPTQEESLKVKGIPVIIYEAADKEMNGRSLWAEFILEGESYTAVNEDNELEQLLEDIEDFMDISD